MTAVDDRPQKANTQLIYTESELMRDHEYASEHLVDGWRMHGGLLADGVYQPPRALVREPALDATVVFRTVDGAAVSGAELIGRFWGGLVHWATVEQPPLFAGQQHDLIAARIAVHPDADRVMAEFVAADDAG